MSTDIFLSHSGEDTSAAKELAGHLRQAGLEVWLDAERLKPGDRWMEEIEHAMGQAAALLVYVGRSGVRNWVDNEVRVALDRNTRDRGFRLIPVLGPESDPESLPLFLKQLQWVHFREGFADPAKLKDIIGAVSETEPQSISVLGPGKAPFSGLRAFDVEDALLFYGRERETEELLDRLRLNRFLAVVGASGSGKSSLVRAGLIPALHRGRFHDGKVWIPSWRVAIFRPGNDPLRELAKVLPDLDPALSAAERADFLGQAAGLVTQGIDFAVSALKIPRGVPALLVVDQFEELFTLVDSVADRKRFIGLLLDATRPDVEHPVHVILTLRADFYHACWSHLELLKRIDGNQYLVQRMGRDELRQVIERPLALAGAKLEQGLADTLLNDVGDEPGNLPLLEHALLQLWELRQNQELTHDAYEKIGRLSGALENHADSVYAELSEGPEQEVARKIFVSLTQLGKASEDTRRRVRKADLLARYSNDEMTTKVLQKLTESRLVTISGEGAADEPASQDGDAGHARNRERDEVEVSHEALIRGWPLLRDWIEADRHALTIQRQIEKEAREWDARGRDRGLLLTGTRLAEATEWISASEGDIGAGLRDLVEASERRASRNAWAFRALVAAVVVGALASGWFFYSRSEILQEQLRAEAIVVDEETGLLWTRNDNARGAGAEFRLDLTWDQAISYCAQLSLFEIEGWRLPTIDELETIYDAAATGSRLPLLLSTNWVWSTSQGDEGSGSALLFDFFVGNWNSAPVGDSNLNRALCVRVPDE